LAIYYADLCINVFIIIPLLYLYDTKDIENERKEYFYIYMSEKIGRTFLSLSPEMIVCYILDTQ